jgi:hypothetical protein
VELPEGSDKAILVVSGVGLNTDPSRCSLLYYNIKGEECYRKCLKWKSDIVSSGAESDSAASVRKTSFEAHFDITGITMSFNEVEEISIKIKVWNCFHIHTWRVQLRAARNVGFVGQVGHGKSHLIEALGNLCADESFAGFEAGWKQAEDEKAHSFLHNGILYYEMPGLVAATGTFRKKIDDKFHSHTPSALVVVFKSGEKFSPEGLPKLIEALRATTKSIQDVETQELEDIVHISVVLTLAPPFTKSLSSCQELLVVRCIHCLFYFSSRLMNLTCDLYAVLCE